MTVPSRVLKASDVVFMDPFDVATRNATSAAVQASAIEDAYAAGLRDGQEGALASVPQLVAALNDAVEQLRSDWKRQSQDDRRVLVDTAAELAQWMVGREITRDPTLAALQVEDALVTVGAFGDVDVFVAPELVNVVEEHWHPTNGAHVYGDNTLLKGEMRVVAGVTSADLRWADALTRVHEALDVVDGE